MIVSWVGLCGIDPALAGNVGIGGSFRAFARGGARMSTFLCSLRTYPAAARGCCSGVVESIFLGF